MGGCGGQEWWRMWWAEEVVGCGGQEIEGTVMFQYNVENIRRRCRNDFLRNFFFFFQGGEKAFQIGMT